MREYEKDADNYLKMSEPHESFDAAKDALAKFYEELGELRRKHKIRDLLCVVYDGYKNEDGNIGEIMHHTAYGNSLNPVVMAAYVYGQEKNERDEMMGKLLSGKK